MLRVAVLIQLALWVVTTSAFFPWIPQYRCENGEACNKKRQLPQDDGLAGREAEAPRPVIVEIAQRASNADESRPDVIPREANRLIKKYDRRRILQNLDRAGKLAKRTNQYTIVPAAVPSLPHAVGIDQDGTDFSYFIPAKFGSSGTSLYMLVDTGAGSTWVMGSDCTSPSCALHNTFGPANSTTLQPPTTDFNISYGTGNVAGSVQEDTISVAGMTFQYQFGIANTTSDDFSNFPFDGILGLSLNQGVNQNFMSVVKNSKQLPANIFGVFLNRNSDGPNTGEISFGATDPAKYTGNIQYTPVDTSGEGDWAVTFDGISYDGNVAAGTNGRLAYIDTGTSYIFGPPEDVAALHKLISGASSSDGVTYTVPCDSTQALAVSFSGVSYTISPKDWISAPSSTGVCTSNLYGHEVVPNSWLLGDLFLKNVYAIFDADHSQIGLANRAAVPGGVTSSNTQSTMTTPAPEAGSSNSPSLGLSGQETGATTGTAAAETASPKPTVSSFGDQLDGPKYVSIICIVAAIVIAA